MYKAEIRLFTRCGHTPITGRGSAYRDQLSCDEVPVTSPEDAYEKARELMRCHPDADSGWITIPDWPNQNQRSHPFNFGTMFPRRTA